MIVFINNIYVLNFRRYFYSFLLYFAVLQLGFAQPQLNFQGYSVTDGLSNNTVWDILQDSAGYVWIATNEGINKFDGYSFKKYLYTKQDDVELQQHNIRALEEDQFHNIWVGTWGGSIYVYNPIYDKFDHISLVSDSSKYNYSFIQDLYFDKHGSMWAGTLGGLVQFNTEDKSFKYHQQSTSEDEGTGSTYAFSITGGEDGYIWVGTLGNGLRLLNTQDNTIKSFTHSVEDKSGLSDNFITAIYYDSKDRLWVGTMEGGLNLLKKGESSFIQYKYEIGNSNSLPNNQIDVIVEDLEGNIWLGTDNGLCLFNEEKNNFTIFRNSPFDYGSISSNSVKSLFVDDQNRLWVGTYHTGLNLSNFYSNSVKFYYQHKNANSLSSNVVSSFVEVDSNTLLVGTDGGGVNIFDRTKEEFSHFEYDPLNKASIASNKVITMAKGSNNDVWLGFWNGGMDRYDTEKQTFEHFRREAIDAKHTLPNNNITALAEDKNGLLWIGTFGEGLFSFDTETYELTPFNPESKLPDGRSFQNVWSILVDSKNDIWVGTNDGYVYRLDRSDNSFKHYVPKQTDKHGYTVLELFEDHLGQVWGGLEGGGLRLLNDKDNELPFFNTSNGLPDNTVHSIEESRDGKLWLGTNAGLVEFDPITKESKKNRVHGGVHKLMANRQAAYLLSTGELAFGGTNGFKIFNPQKIKKRGHSTSIMFTNFEIFNQPVEIGKEDSPLYKDINYIDSITLSYNQSVFSISYAGINFTDPEMVQYRYRLLGFIDESWQEVGLERKVTYTNLAPKEYVFEVEGRINGETIPARALYIEVIPPWWKTIWFRMVAFVSLVLMIYSYFWVRFQNIKKQNKILEIKVNERTKRLQSANDELSQKNYLIQEQNEEIQTQSEELEEYNREIHLINERLEETVAKRTARLKKSNEELDNFVYRVSHDIRAPLSSILGLLDLMKMEELHGKLKSYVDMVNLSITKLDTFVKNILDYSRNSRLTLKPEQIDFTKLLDDIVEELKYMQNADNLHLIRDFKIETDYYNDPVRLQVIFRNLLSNAIKYQNPYEEYSYVKVKIAVTKDELNLFVEDNGVGIRENDKQRIFEMFFRSDNKAAGSGLGLYIVKETVEKLGGNISLNSEINKGTTFIVNLPNITEVEIEENAEA